MTYQIVPHEGLSVARFGEPRGELRARLGEDFRTFQRTPNGSPVDHFTDLGLQLNFDSDDLLEFIEVTAGAEDVEFRGVQLLDRRYRDVVSALGAQGVEGAEDDSGIEFTEQGFALFVADPEEPDEEVQGVAVFPRGYYS